MVEVEIEVPTELGHLTNHFMGHAKHNPALYRLGYIKLEPSNRLSLSNIYITHNLGRAQP